ncbi:MAG: hypothetical protein J3K34DRAFT_421428 [Monoraphidium minutum]|nr:MAG: hypothetical protein J3K34DRAFT_421428 [Monoraphidium minutum]
MASCPQPVSAPPCFAPALIIAPIATARQTMPLWCAPSTGLSAPLDGKLPAAAPAAHARVARKRAPWAACAWGQPAVSAAAPQRRAPASHRHHARERPTSECGRAQPRRPRLPPGGGPCCEALPATHTTRGPGCSRGPAAKCTRPCLPRAWLPRPPRRGASSVPSCRACVLVSSTPAPLAHNGCCFQNLLLVW